MEKVVSIYSDGLKIAGVLFEPEEAGDKSCPGIVLCQGMAGVKEYFWFPDIARYFAALGYVALIWDYRGVGESEGEYGRLYPLEQAEDIRNALTSLQLHPKVDPERLAIAEGNDVQSGNPLTSLEALEAAGPALNMAPILSN